MASESESGIERDEKAEKVESESGDGVEKTKKPESELKKLERMSRESIKHGTSESESEKLRPWCRIRES